MNIEKIYLGVVFTLLLFLGVGNFWDHQVHHSFPYGYLASDTFQQQTRAEGIKDNGHYANEPHYLVKGFEDVIGYYPPQIHHLGILLHYSTGIPLHDTLYFMVFLSAIAAAFVMYVIIRRINKQIAMLSLPLALLLFGNKSYIGFTFGHWASIAGQLFMLGGFWALLNFEKKYVWALLGIFFGALALSHTSELVYAAAFTLIFLAHQLLTKKMSAELIKKLTFATFLALLIGGYNLFIFSQSFLPTNPYQFEFSYDWGGTPIFDLKDFKFLLLFMAIGLVAGAFAYKKMGLEVALALFMLGVGYTNYIGFGIRAYQPRLLWPVYLAILFGIGLYALIKFVPKAFRSLTTLGVCALWLIILGGFVSTTLVPQYYPLSSPGLMTSWHWEMYEWVDQNTPKDARVYFFYGDAYMQDAILRNSKRTHALIKPEDFVTAIENRSIERIFYSETPADHGAGIPYKTGLFTIERHLADDDFEEGFWAQRDYDICDFDYFVFDKASRQQAFAQYNLILAQALVNNGSPVVFQNDLVLIVQNKERGSDCIETGNF